MIDDEEMQQQVSSAEEVQEEGGRGTLLLEKELLKVDNNSPFPIMNSQETRRTMFLMIWTTLIATYWWRFQTYSPHY